LHYLKLHLMLWRSIPKTAAMQILKAGLLYFAIVFGAGFVLRPMRTLSAVPRFGIRMLN
jgi:hypothetical protein